MKQQFSVNKSLYGVLLIKIMERLAKCFTLCIDNLFVEVNYQDYYENTRLHASSQPVDLLISVRVVLHRKPGPIYY